MSAARPLAAIVGSGNIGTDLCRSCARCGALEPRSWSASTRPPGPARAPKRSGSRRLRRRRRLAARARRASRASSSRRPRPPAHRANAPRYEAARDPRDRPDARQRSGPFVVPGGQPRPAARRAEREHDQLWRPGDGPDRRRCRRGSPRSPTPRSSRRSLRALAPGPEPAQNIDEFTETTRARRSSSSAAPTAAKAIIILNPADPPITDAQHRLLRASPGDADQERIAALDRGDGRRPSQRYVPATASSPGRSSIRDAR